VLREGFLADLARNLLVTGQFLRRREQRHRLVVGDPVGQLVEIGDRALRP
jgi:hypothetical protein